MATTAKRTLTKLPLGRFGSLRWPRLLNGYSRLDSLPLADEKRLGVYAPSESGLCGT